MPSAPVGWTGALALALILFATGVVVLFVTPSSDRWQKKLADLGALIAGLWALSAGLLAYSAAIWSVSAQEELRTRQVAAAFSAEIQAAWDYLDTQGILDALAKSTVQIGNDKSTEHSYRSHVGRNWLNIQVTNPELFGTFEPRLAKDLTSYYSKMNMAIGRLNWMNDEQFPPDQWPAVRERQQQTENELRDLLAKKAELLQRLNMVANR